MNNFVIGLTGAFGSGCTKIADIFLVKNKNYVKFSLSNVLKEEYERSKGHAHRKREDLQLFGNELRKTDPAYLSKKVVEEIKGADFTSDQCIVIDSIRNPSEIGYFRNTFTNFYLFGIFADREVRWDRVKEDYNYSVDEFNDDEYRDQGLNEPDYGQKVSNCFFEADLILSNNALINFEKPNKAYRDLENKLDSYIAAFQSPRTSHPTIQESLMATAYAIGRRSKCLKRKVGAIITDEHNNILSSGYNEVPFGIADCNGKHGDCYRDIIRGKLKEEFRRTINNFMFESLGLKDSLRVDATISLTDKIVKKTKVLELCRALHAEENAILNLTHNSSMSDYSKCTLYATTYPCNLCANKIVEVGIKNVIYYEPYPVEEAKEIFKEGNVTSIPFEGVTFRAFFRAFDFSPD